MEKKNEVKDKSLDFAVRIINLSKYLTSEKRIIQFLSKLPDVVPV